MGGRQQPFASLGACAAAWEQRCFAGWVMGLSAAGTGAAQRCLLRSAEDRHPQGFGGSFLCMHLHGKHAVAVVIVRKVVVASAPCRAARTMRSLQIARGCRFLLLRLSALLCAPV
jgi:hypothetical protein